MEQGKLLKLHRLAPWRYALYLLGSLKFAPKLSLWVVHIGEFRSSDSGRAASRLSLRFVFEDKTSAMGCMEFSGRNSGLGSSAARFFQ